MGTHAAPQHGKTAASGPEGNEHLTAMTGAVLLVGFAVEGATILELNRLLWLHFAVGFLLLGPAILKIGSTLYRFAQYYAGAAPYLRKGPPAPALRILGPLVILTSVAVLGTGVVLAVLGPGRGQWLFLHKAAFVLWSAVMTVHVVAYAPRLPRLLLGSRTPGHRGPSAAPGATARYLAVAAAVAAGIVIAAVSMHLQNGWTGGSALPH
jgi:hypothetical protein